jgi:putative membrane protein
MLIKRNFNPWAVLTYIWKQLLYATFFAILAYSLVIKFGYSHLQLPFSVLGVLGTALAIFLAFRNNTSYGRWWEARQLWGSIVNSSRVFARLVVTFSDSHAHQPNYDKNRSKAFKKSMIYKQIAWAQALRLHLRKQENWDEIKPFLNENEFNDFLKSQNKPNFLQLLIGKQLYEAMANGTLAGFDSFQIEGQLLVFANCQGACERIKNTPMLRQYDFFTRIFILIFMALFPFAIIDSFKAMPILVIPFSIIIAFVFITINKVSVVNETPFENKVQDVPMTALCNTIERDLRETLGEINLPSKVEPQNGVLF